MSETIPQALRRLADMLEAIQPKLIGANDVCPDSSRTDTYVRESLNNCSIDVNFHWCNSLNNLKLIRSLVPSMTADKSRGTHWVKGDLHPSIEVTAYYTAGLLGKTTKRKVVERTCETTNLSVLD